MRPDAKTRSAGRPTPKWDHACFGTGDKLAVFDVWDSQQAFERFGETLMPILTEVGVDPGQRHVMPIHNIITG